MKEHRELSASQRRVCFFFIGHKKQNKKMPTETEQLQSSRFEEMKVSVHVLSLSSSD